MKRKNQVRIFCLLGILALLLMACPTNQVTVPSTKPDALKNPFVVSSYKTLFTLAQTYNAAWLTFRQLHTDGVVSDADFQAGQKIARQYRQANSDAVDALIQVENGTLSQDQAQVMIGLAMSINGQIMAYLGPRVAKKPPPLPATN